VSFTSAESSGQAMAEGGVPRALEQGADGGWGVSSLLLKAFFFGQLPGCQGTVLLSHKHFSDWICRRD
jgi:hypothetical protein